MIDVSDEQFCTVQTICHRSISKGKDYVLTDCLTDYRQWWIQHRQKPRMMTTMTRHLPHHQWHQNHCHANDSWQQIQPAVYMVDSRFIKCFMFYQKKKRGVQSQENVKSSQPMSREKQPVLCVSVVWVILQNLMGATTRRIIIKQVYKNLTSLQRGCSKIPFKNWYKLLIGLM